MSLTRKQKNFINANHTKLDVASLSKIIKAREKDVEIYLYQFLQKKEKFASQNLKVKDSQKNLIETKNETSKTASFIKTTPAMKYENNSGIETFSLNPFKLIRDEFWFLIPVFIFIFFLYIRGFSGILLSDEIMGFNDFNATPFDISKLRIFHYSFFTLSNLALFGLDGFAHRFMVLLLHFANIILFYSIFRNFYPDKAVKVAILVISCHTLIVESLVWVAAHSYVYMTFLYLMGMIFSLLYHKSEKIIHHIIACLFIVILTLSGSHTNFAPIVFFIFNFFFLKRTLKKELILSGWLFLLIPIYTLTNTATITSRVESLTTGPFIPKFIQTLPFTVAKSTEIVVFPLNVTFFHEETMYPLYYLSAQLFTLFAIGFFIWLFFKSTYYFRLLFLGLAVPIYMFSPIQVSWFVAERYLYFTVFTFCLFFGLFYIFLQKKFGKMLPLIILCSYFIFFTYRSFMRMNDWQTAVLLWSQNAIMAPDSLRVRNNLGDAYSLLGDFENAKKQFQEVIRIGPNSGQGQTNMGITYLKEGKLSEAKSYLIAGLQANPNSLQAILVLAIVHANLKEYIEAENLLTMIERSQNVPAEITSEIKRIRDFIESNKKQ